MRTRLLLRFLSIMASLVLVDLCVTGIFISVSGRLSVIGSDLVANLALLGGFNTAGAWLLFRPILIGLRSDQAVAHMQQRLALLPWIATGWAMACTICYCIAASYLGIFIPSSADLSATSPTMLAAGAITFSGLYATYYGFYIYFAVSDFTHDLKLTLARYGLACAPEGGRFLHKLIAAFLVAAFLPSTLIALDLSVFRELRALQGLTMQQTLFLDLLASAFLVTVALVFVARSLARPINELTAAMQGLKEGRLDTRAAVISNDELGILSERYNEMLDGLRDREFIRETFGRYLPERVASTLLAHRGVLEPQVRIATVLFIDIEGFTQIAERQAPALLFRMLNEFFSTVIERVNDAGGVVNHFQGDAMLVTFNVPVPDAAHADNALAAAIEIQRAIADRAFAGVELRARIGINTGEVIAGAVGSKDRATYTVYGDAVNLAARLEQLNKSFGTQVLISGSTVTRVTRDFPIKPVGQIAIWGKRDAACVYQLSLATGRAEGDAQATAGDSC